MARRPRVLIVAYHYPPERSAGSIRPSALVKYLPRHGWEVDLIVRSPPGLPPDGRVTLVPHEAWMVRLRQLGVRPDRWFGTPPLEHRPLAAPAPSRRPSGRAWDVFRYTGWQLLTFPDRAYDWYGAVKSAARDHLREHPPDVVLTTSPPEVSHFIGRWAKRVSGCAWIADLRDPWWNTQLHVRPDWRRALDRRVERDVLGSADGITTVNESWGEELARSYRHVTVIRNGFDPDSFPGASIVERSAFELLFAGEINPARQDSHLLFEGMRRFLDRHESASASVRIRIMGEAPDAVRTQIREHRLEAHVRVEPRRPHEEAVAAMRGAAANVLFPLQDPLHPGHYAAKLFEYLGARRPILVIGAKPMAAGRLATESGLGRAAGSAEEVAQLLARLWDAWKDGRDAWAGDEQQILRHSHERMVEAFADELARVSPASAAGHTHRP